jgi:hypothetical protein
MNTRINPLTTSRRHARLQRFVHAILLASTQAAILAAAAVTTPAIAAARPTINVTGSVVTLGTTVAVYGETPTLLQTVRLEMETAESGGQEVDRVVNILSGATPSRRRAGTAPIDSCARLRHSPAPRECKQS